MATAGGASQARDLRAYTGKTVVVTGCSSGIGQAVVRELADEGADIVGMDLTEPSAPVGSYVQVDLGEETSIDAALAQLSTVDALFNCAGISGAFDPLTVMTVNFIGTRKLTEGIIPLLPSGAAIASISSTAAVDFEDRLETITELVHTKSFGDARIWCSEHIDAVQTAAYALSKAAIIVYTMRRSFELAPLQIRMNSIGPGVTDTPFLEGTKRKIGQAGIEAIPKPLGRVAQPEEQASVLTFLNSGAASYVTGQNIWVDGGFMGAAMIGMIDGSVLGYRRRSESLRA